MKIGINLGFVRHYSEPFFSNAYLQAFENQYDVVVYRNLKGNYPGGRYYCKFEGGSLDFRRDAVLVNQIGDTYELEVTPSNHGIVIKKLGGAKIISLYHENELENDSSFHSLMLSRLDCFDTVRFMNPLAANTETISLPRDITAYGVPQDSPNGISPRYVVEFAEDTGKDVWVTLPLLATDSTIARLAKIYEKVPTKLYVEYSNELWNSAFLQAYRFQNLFGASIGTDRWLRILSKRICHVFETFKANCNKEVSLVLASQLTVPFYMNELIRRVEIKIDYIACATYLIGRNNQTEEQAVDALLAYRDETLIPRIQDYKELSEQYGIPLITYEGGLDIENNAFDCRKFLYERGPDIIRSLYEVVGGYADLCMHYRLSGQDCWGVYHNYEIESPLKQVFCDKSNPGGQNPPLPGTPAKDCSYSLIDGKLYIRGTTDNGDYVDVYMSQNGKIVLEERVEL